MNVLSLPLRVANPNEKVATMLYVFEDGEPERAGYELFVAYGAENNDKAAEIVRRVNLHDELVEALRGVSKRIKQNGGFVGLDGQYQKVINAILTKVDAAKVEG